MNGSAQLGGSSARASVRRAFDLSQGLSLGVFVLVLALLLGQTLGQLHRVVHAKQAVHAVSVLVPFETATGVDSVWQGLWGEHASLADCQLFDQTCPDVLQHAVWTMPVLHGVMEGPAALLHTRFALFERFFAARAPPVLR
jgi:hypothetical protein